VSQLDLPFTDSLFHSGFLQKPHFAGIRKKYSEKMILKPGTAKPKTVARFTAQKAGSETDRAAFGPVFDHLAAAPGMKKARRPPSGV
jgi:hypothetical protein